MTDLKSRLSFNERRFLELLFREKGLSRKDLADQMAITGASITRIASRLLDEGIISENIERLGALGQPRRPLCIAPGRIFAAGINFSLNTVDVALVDLAGDVIAVKTNALERSSPLVAAEHASAMLADLLQSHDVDRAALVGVGVSVPANFPAAGNSVLPNALFTEYDDIDLESIFAATLGIETIIENDGACAALGEYYFAEGYHHEIFFKYHLGHGFTAGVVLNGRLYRGAHGNACVTGVLFPYGQPRPTGTDLLLELATVGIVLTDIADLDEIPAHGQVVVERWLERAALQLEGAVRIATGFYDPSIIVIGGRLPKRLTENLTDRIRWRDLAGPSRGLAVAPVVPSKLGPSSGAIGAACVPFFARFFPGAMQSGFNNYANGRRPLSF